jgi:ABC-type multidrug transport system ATPase subunit
MTQAEQPAAVSARALSHRYGERLALDSVDLDVAAGVVFGLLGPNGSGKSTFLTLLAALEKPQSGSITVFGRPPEPALRARIGTVFQENAQDPLMRVGEHMTLAGRMFGLPRSVLQGRTLRLLDAFGLRGRDRERISSLSGGMRRRLEVARALLHDPDLLLLDEPTTGVDADERAAIWQGIRNGRDRTVILATNDLAEADNVCDQVAFVRAGKVVASGTPGGLKRGLRRDSVRLLWPGVREDQLNKLGGLRGVGTVAVDGANVVVTVDEASGFVAEVFHMAPGEIREASIEAASLEDAYFQVVGRRERLTSGSEE